MIVWGALRAGTPAVLGGCIAFVLSGLLLLGTTRKRRQGVIALSREGPWLVGEELRHRLPARDTTFEFRSDYQGSWVVVLRCRDEAVVLSTGHWRISGRRRASRHAVRDVLLALGLREAGG